jgi:hypothetical protein
MNRSLNWPRIDATFHQLALELIAKSAILESCSFFWFSPSSFWPPPSPPGSARIRVTWTRAAHRTRIPVSRTTPSEARHRVHARKAQLSTHPTKPTCPLDPATDCGWRSRGQTAFGARIRRWGSARSQFRPAGSSPPPAVRPAGSARCCSTARAVSLYPSYPAISQNSRSMGLRPAVKTSRARLGSLIISCSARPVPIPTASPKKVAELSSHSLGASGNRQKGGIRARFRVSTAREPALISAEIRARSRQRSGRPPARPAHPAPAGSSA